MPKDEWRRARDRDIARRAEREIATGGLRSYEALSDEVTPLDKINVLTSRLATDEPELRPPNPPKVQPTPPPSSVGARFRAPSASVRFPVENGVSVLVNIDRKSGMSVVQALDWALVQARKRYNLGPRMTSAGVSVEVTIKRKPSTSIVHALERALSQARKRYDLEPRMTSAAAAPNKAQRRKRRRRETGPDSGERGLDWLVMRLTALAQAMAAENLMRPEWQQECFARWRQDLSNVRRVPTFTTLMVEFEVGLNSKDLRLLRWKARCQEWRYECYAARNSGVAGRLLAELAYVLQLG